MKYTNVLFTALILASNPVERVWHHFVVDEKMQMCSLENQPLVYSPTSLRLCPHDNRHPEREKGH